MDYTELDYQTAVERYAFLKEECEEKGSASSLAKSEAEELFKVVEFFANKGNLEAQVELSKWYFYGKLIDADYNLSFTWMEKAAKKSNA